MLIIKSANQKGYPIDTLKMILLARQLLLDGSILLKTQPVFVEIYGFLTGIATSMRNVRNDAISNLAPAPMSIAISWANVVNRNSPPG